jgi:cytosine/adenosine deaminase-related metal-dependent hydrolase
MTDDYALTGVTAILGRELEVVEDATIIVSQGTIVDVGRRLSTGGIRRLDRPNWLVVPGFINCHTHVGDAFLAEEGFRVEAADLLYGPHGLRHRRLAAADQDRVTEGMRRSMKYMLRSGTVAFADFREQGLAGVEALRTAAAGLPIRALAMGRHAQYPVQTDEQREQNTAGLDMTRVNEIESILAVADGFSVVSPNDMTDAALVQTRDLAREAGKTLAAHAGETGGDREVSISRTGASDIVRAIEVVQPDYLVHLTAATDEELALAAQRQIPIVMCPRSHAGLGFGVPRFLAALAAGATVGIGTDNAMTTSPNVLAEINFLCKIERMRAGTVAVPEPRDLLAAITTRAAEILGFEQLGSLDPAKEATMVAFDWNSSNLRDATDPLAALVNRAETADISTVLVQGRPLDGRLADSTPTSPALAR